jgi:uncharacterized protein YegL
MDQGKLLPFYLVADVSYSMSGRKLAALNQVLPSMLDALVMNPILSDKIRVGLIDFSDDARVRLPLCDPLDENLTLPQLSVRGGTSYAAAFRLLRQEIESNVKQMKVDGFQVHRPAVFFLSDGNPTDSDSERRAAFLDLTGVPAYPNIIPCGVDEADPQVLQSLIHPGSGHKAMRMYLMDKGEDAAKAISAISEILISSVIASGHSMASGSSGVLLPDDEDLPAGITAYGADDDFV